MGTPPTTLLRIGEWRVNPASGEISRNGDSARVEARTMRLLLCLAEHAGEVVSVEDLLNFAWSGVIVSPDSVYQAVASLRRLLGDDSKQPSYIATVPRLGYRMVATVSPWSEDQPREEAPPNTSSRKIAVAVCVVIVIASIFIGRVLLVRPKVANGPPQKSIAVLPFLDLTDAMSQEPFADGMTEELIDRFSKIPGLRVPGATSSFYFKGKHVPIPDIAKALGVAYVLDGSVRKSGARLRVAARLIRAANGYVVWSETYDRPLDDILMVQDDIAGEVTKALSTSIGAAPDRDKAR
jgi:TolB-like protein/DNA-binding winged helix-turn-helix (wHTH) protein